MLWYESELVVLDHHRHESKKRTRAQAESKNITLRSVAARITDGGKEWVHVTVANNNALRYDDSDDSTRWEEERDLAQSTEKFRQPIIFTWLRLGLGSSNADLKGKQL